MGYTQLKICFKNEKGLIKRAGNFSMTAYNVIITITYLYCKKPKGIIFQAQNIVLFVPFYPILEAERGGK